MSKSKSVSRRKCSVLSYILVVAEKPKAAHQIAKALGGSQATKCSYHGIPYWIVKFDGKTLVIAPSAGHLFGLTTDLDGFPVYKYYWAPLHEIENSSMHLRKFYEMLKKLSLNAYWYINACDYDIEGSVIGYLIIRSFGDTRRASRAVFSTLTKNDVQRAFRRLQPLDWKMIEAGLARHELDWLWGINISRALMKSLHVVSGKKIILSAGRVQSPTLAELARRDMERSLFIPLPSFHLNAIIDFGDGIRKEITLYASTDYNSVVRVSKIVSGQQYLSIVRVVERVKTIQPPPPFNLGDLQAEAWRVYKLSPLTVQNTAERLYLDALISYPRTNSQKIPDTIDVKSIVLRLAEIPSYKALAEELLRFKLLKPRNGEKEDPAHPAIYPTGLKPKKLSGLERKIYDLIVRRFLSSMHKPAIVRELSIVVVVPSTKIKHQITLSFLVEKNWLKIYPFIKLAEEYTYDNYLKVKETILQRRLRIVKTSIKRVFSQPPKPHTKSSIVRWMEDVGIGTEATRARIVETLFARGYVRDVRGEIIVTDLGYAISEVLDRYFEKITKVELTRSFENMLSNIRSGRESRKEVIEKAKKVLTEMLEEFKEKHLFEAGYMLARALGYTVEKNRCKICGRPVIEEGLCKYHLLALRKLKESFSVWERRIPDISWEEYLRILYKSKSTGRWVREVVALFIHQ